jgi:hypothetical protein
MRKVGWRIALVLTAQIFSAPVVFAQNAADGDGRIKPGKNSKWAAKNGASALRQSH